LEADALGVIDRVTLERLAAKTRPKLEHAGVGWAMTKDTLPFAGDVLVPLLDGRFLKLADHRVELEARHALVSCVRALLFFERPLVLAQERADIDEVGDLEQRSSDPMGDRETYARDLEGSKQEEEEAARRLLVDGKH